MAVSPRLCGCVDIWLTTCISRNGLPVLGRLGKTYFQFWWMPTSCWTQACVFVPRSQRRYLYLLCWIASSPATSACHLGQPSNKAEHFFGPELDPSETSVGGATLWNSIVLCYGEALTSTYAVVDWRLAVVRSVCWTGLKLYQFVAEADQSKLKEFLKLPGAIDTVNCVSLAAKRHAEATAASCW